MIDLSIQIHNDVVVEEDPFTGELRQRPRAQLVNIDLVHLVATFPRVKDAVRFVETYLAGDGCSFEANVRRTGREVRWDAAVSHEPPVSSVGLYVEGLLEYVAGTRGRLGFSRTSSEPAATLAPRRSY